MSSGDEEMLGHALDVTDVVSAEQAALSKKITQAVAIEYDRDALDVPHVVANAKGALAEQILAIAFANGIKVRSDADLIEVLKQVDVDSPIPLEAFAAVAEILSYVYKANASMKQRKANTMHKDDTE